MLTNNMHNLTKVLRTRSPQGVFSDYPHFYKLVQEGKQLTPENSLDTSLAQEGEDTKTYFGDLFA